MVYKFLLIEDYGSFQVVTINRPEALNALNLVVFQELKSYLIQVEENQKIRCIVITGAGNKAFVAGADITEFNSIAPGEAKSYLSLGNEIMQRIENFHIPFIAAINGFALGGGCELALACHMRIAGEHARFGMPEINLGILPGYGGTQRLTAVVGKSKAMEMILSGEMINAQEALQFSLVNKIVAVGTEVQMASDLAQKIATKAPLAVRSIIKAVNYSHRNTEHGIALEGDLFNSLADTDDFKEGTKAFLEKRKPVFLGK
jgi:enoyl-CoA hydratase